MYYNDLLKVRVNNFKDLNKFNHLPQGTVVIVNEPIEHKWIKMEDGWYNMNPEVLNNIYKLEFENNTIKNKLMNFLNKVKNIIK